jgi:hypothetical protein
MVAKTSTKTSSKAVNETSVKTSKVVNEATTGGSAKTSKSSVKKSVEKNDEQDGGKTKKRHFNMIFLESGEKRGYYEGSTPKNAANRAYSSYVKELRHQNKKIPSKINFGIIETTRGSRNNVTCYTGSRSKLDTPLVIQRAGTHGEVKPITYNYRNNVTRNSELDHKYGGTYKKTTKKTSKKGTKQSSKKGSKKGSKKSVKKISKKSKVVTEEAVEQSVKKTKKSSKKGSKKVAKKSVKK